MLSTRSLWATTHCPGARVKIWLDDSLDGSWAETDLKHGVCDISLHPKALSDKRLAAWLFHEFVHVVEYLNDPAHLSVEVEDDCTALAQTLEKQLLPLITKLVMKNPKTPNPFKAR